MLRAAQADRRSASAVRILAIRCRSRRSRESVFVYTLLLETQTRRTSRGQSGRSLAASSTGPQDRNSSTRESNGSIPDSPETRRTEEGCVHTTFRTSASKVRFDSGATLRLRLMTEVAAALNWGTAKMPTWLVPPVIKTRSGLESGLTGAGTPKAGSTRSATRFHRSTRHAA